MYATKIRRQSRLFYKKNISNMYLRIKTYYTYSQRIEKQY